MVSHHVFPWFNWLSLIVMLQYVLCLDTDRFAFLLSLSTLGLSGLFSIKLHFFNLLFYFFSLKYESYALLSNIVQQLLLQFFLLFNIITKIQKNKLYLSVSGESRPRIMARRIAISQSNWSELKPPWACVKSNLHLLSVTMCVLYQQHFNSPCCK